MKTNKEHEYETAERGNDDPPDFEEPYEELDRHTENELIEFYWNDEHRLGC